jgi:hypothetical protein
MFKKGDEIIITYDGLAVDGTVRLASPNNKSLMLSFEAILGKYVGMMAVLLDNEGTYRDLIFKQQVGIKPKGGDDVGLT